MTNYIFLISLGIGLISKFVTTQDEIYFPKNNEQVMGEELYFRKGDVEDDDKCITPKREIGTCIEFNECHFLFNIYTSRTLGREEKIFFLNSRCGPTNGKSKICCPAKYRQANPLSSSNSLLPQAGVCGSHNVFSERIYGGNVAKIDEFPWMALIEYALGNGKTAHKCGGSLISKRYVLTACHCVKFLPSGWKLNKVRLGEWDTTTNPDCENGFNCAPPHIDIPVEQIIAHSGYDPNSRNRPHDIALLRLDRNVEFTEFIRPICLPVDQSLRRSNFENKVMYVAGWGKTESSASSSLKLKANVDVTTLESCQQLYRSVNANIGSDQLCAGGVKGIDSCQGDSGGPLMGFGSNNKVPAYYYIAGIVSFGRSQCGQDGWPGVYTKVGPYVPWIEERIKA